MEIKYDDQFIRLNDHDGIKDVCIERIEEYIKRLKLEELFKDIEICGRYNDISEEYTIGFIGKFRNNEDDELKCSATKYDDYDATCYMLDELEEEILELTIKEDEE
jgi:hypothetical protein